MSCADRGIQRGGSGDAAGDLELSLLKRLLPRLLRAHSGGWRKVGIVCPRQPIVPDDAGSSREARHLSRWRLRSRNEGREAVQHLLRLRSLGIPHRQAQAREAFGSTPMSPIAVLRRKVHLFDIDIPGKITFKESETLTPGDHPTLFDTEFGKCAVGICYDIRFAELALLYAKNGAKLIVYPGPWKQTSLPDGRSVWFSGAFNTTTGPAHWELLQRARAADNQVFVAMCSPARNEDGYQVRWCLAVVLRC